MNFIGPVTSSGALTADAQISTIRGFFHTIVLTPPTTGLFTVEVFDSENSTTAGKLSLGKFICAAGQNTLYFAMVVPMVANKGIYAVVSSGTSTYVIGYSI